MLTRFSDFLLSCILSPLGDFREGIGGLFITKSLLMPSCPGDVLGGIEDIFSDILLGFLSFS